MKDELQMEHALDILNRRIAKYMRDNKNTNLEDFKKRLIEFSKEEDKIYELDEETIEKVFEQYLKEIKEQEFDLI